MTKKEFREIIYLDHLINSKLRLLDSLKSSRLQVKGMQLKSDVVQVSKQGNRQEDLIIKIIDLEKEITKDIDSLICEKKKAKTVIDKLDGPYRLVMSMRYLECMKWEEIAYRIGYSIQAVYKIHGQALKRVE
ncbi:DUF1492 domain-containing protein [Peptoniphilus hominis (ex Hitch et al. 2025)]|uniref:DUF1492 domain-containing protein n=1 Tax=Peptoniphilus hominis (ex Hitch et al. 2025) TaxID=3133174 RepID=A0ABV1CBV0_9FIRM